MTSDQGKLFALLVQSLNGLVSSLILARKIPVL